MIIAKFAAVIIGGYILGSIPFGVIISRWSARVDVRDFGSGKTGATNVLRVAGKKAALTAVLLDFLKGTLAVFLAGLLFRGGTLAVASGWGLAAGAQVLAGMAAAREVARQVDETLELEPLASDGDALEPGVVVCRVRGLGRSILAFERTALNFIQQLSGVATLTRAFVDAAVAALRGDASLQ